MGKRDNFELIFVDDGSCDSSREVLRQISMKDSFVRSIFLRKNFGKAIALTAGFLQAKGTIIITMDGDLQDRPEEMPKMIKKINEGCDCVSGWRRVRQDGILRKCGSWLFNRVVSSLGGIRLHDFNCGFKAYKAKVVKTIPVYGQQYRFMPLLAHFAGFKVDQVEVVHDRRRYGTSKYPTFRYQGFFDLLSILFIYRYRFSPLYFFGMLSAFFILPSTLVIFYLGAAQVLYVLGFGERFNVLIQNRPIFALSLTTCLLGMNIFMAGFICEYVLHQYEGRKISDSVNSLIDELL